MTKYRHVLAIAMGIITASHAGWLWAEWPQLQGSPQRSGNVPAETLEAPLGLRAAIPCSDAILASPVIADGKIFVVDAAGVVWAIDAQSLQVLWKFATPGGAGNCNNVAAPAVLGNYLHVGTMAGYYFVFDTDSGEVVTRIDCGEPIFSAPAVGEERVYFATLGARVYAVEPQGQVAWTWDFVKEVVGFDGDRWSGADWVAFRGDRVTWKDHFVCSRDICLLERTIVMPAGGRTVFLDDSGANPELRAVGTIPSFAGSEYPATFGQSADDEGRVYVQWHRRDNAGRVEVLKLVDDEVQADFVAGTETSIERAGLLSFAAVSVRGNDVYRVRPEQGMGLCRHTRGTEQPQVLAAAGGISPPVLTRDRVLYGGLDGKLYSVPLGETGETTTFATAFGAPISAPLAVDDGRVYVGCEDGYLYILDATGQAPLPEQDLQLTEIRSPLRGKYADEKYDWYTNYGDFSGTNANDQGLVPPLRMRWAQRLAGTVKHLPVCGGGRMYMHTAEGQIIAVEQDTGRLLWRRYWPDVYLSFTSPLYYQGKLIVPQAGIRRSQMRCLDAATGELQWEVPFTGSPSWSRQFPPVVQDNVVIYASGSGEYAAQGTEKPFIFRGEPVEREGREVMSWIYSNDNPYYPRDHRPRIWAWDLNSGEVLWEKDFSEYGRGGNDCGICLHEGKLFYSV
ncbi:MAG: PQQ-binding-like beta-propeller repeat protein, partial [Planctomycetales bacterium]|nr:PQQ-binding-like beta-propeller repeat protein [Planctomycetales bacterium]